jgi:glycerol-3-phosphate dehydrogenase
VRIAVVGGGINGSGVTWELARKGYDVTLFERNVCGAQTSSATTKLIHGGLRYLEGLHVALVRESLRERAWLLENLPQLVTPVEIVLPVYRDSPRFRVTIRLGLALYDTLAGRDNVRRHSSLTASGIAGRVPVTDDQLLGGFSYWDAQVDDFALVRLVIASAIRDGAHVREHTTVSGLRRDGEAWLLRTTESDEGRFDMLVNTAGPWMNQLLAVEGLDSRYHLSLVRGSHLVLGRRVSDAGVLLQSIGDRRVLFVLPWKGATLVGTTEVLQSDMADSVQPSGEEIDYLIARFNRYFREPIGHDDVASTFAGVRPLVGRAANSSAISREYRVERHGSLINVWGGKMTTFMSLARKVSLRVDNYAGSTRVARPPVFALEQLADTSTWSRPDQITAPAR